VKINKPIKNKGGQNMGKNQKCEAEDIDLLIAKLNQKESVWDKLAKGIRQILIFLAAIGLFFLGALILIKLIKFAWFL
jgi:hypothetical protein